VKAALVISDRDNVATALEPLEPGRLLEINGRVVTVQEGIPSGHKVALLTIERGHPVIKYGSTIGTAISTISAGTHVHIHNVASGRGRGDVAAAPKAPGPRLAEPPDELSDVEPQRSDTRRPG
jgi:hypothetical protein